MAQGAPETLQLPSHSSRAPETSEETPITPRIRNPSLKSALKLPKSRTKSELAKTDGWQLQGKRISKLFVFEDFMGVIRFLNRVARIAEAMNHHPDITINYNKIKLSLTTHDEGGLTIKDFKLGRRINAMKHI